MSLAVVEAGPWAREIKDGLIRLHERSNGYFMSYSVEIISLEAQPALLTRFRARPENLGQKFLELLPQILEVVLATDGEMAGAPFARYLDVSGPELDVEVGLPIVAPVPGKGNVICKPLPAGPAAVTWHIGSYEELGNAHAALAEWARANGRTAAGGSWEVYISDPSDDDDPSGWRTKVVLPLVPLADG